MNKSLKLVMYFVLSATFLHADYPEIKSLDSGSIIFKQFSEDINRSYRKAASNALSRGNNDSPLSSVPLSIAYYKRKYENLFQFSARLNLPYETLSTLNRLSKPDDFMELEMVLFPNQPALFIADNASSDIEHFLSVKKKSGEKITVNFKGKKEVFYIIKNGRFNATERSLFLNTYFRFPIDKGKISSYYGNRPHPFTGKLSFHNGIDIAAPVGTAVYAAASGGVYETGFDNVLGNYVIIEHMSGFYSIYGHLSQILVLLKSDIKTGIVIGKVGNTGYSTGPHLHFEIRKKGKSQDPLKYIRGKSK
jgi:murein DD-endopeptidase MepM/ murein hydrolase activator NlpD